ncbi:MAG: tetratricopeptide repeat protein [Thermodesulfobacteriota bacterium]
MSFPTDGGSRRTWKIVKKIFFLEHGSTRLIRIAALAVAVVTFLLYIPSLDNLFVNWDDYDYIYQNENIRSLDLEFFKWAFTSSDVFYWHPLTFISLGLNYAVSGLNPMSYHLVNNLLHSLNSALVLLLTYAVLLRVWACDESKSRRIFIAALATALIFALHPLRVESVAWISERKDVLCSFFYLSSVLVYLRYVGATAGKKFYYMAAFFLFVLSGLSKPMAITIPVVCLMLDYYPLNRVFTGAGKWPAELAKVFIEKIPFFICAVFISGITYWSQLDGAMVTTIGDYPLSNRLIIAGYSYIFYLYKMALPLVLHPYYAYPAGIALFKLKYLSAIVIFFAISIFVIYKFKSRRALFMAWLYYVITLFPVIGITHIGQQMAADRYTYLPGLSILMLVGVGFAALYERCSASSLKYLPVVVGVAVLSAFSIKTATQQEVWRDSVTMWSYELELYPYQLPSFYNSRGSAYLELGDKKRAMDDYNTTLKLTPEYAFGYLNRAKLNQDEGRLALAIEDYTNAIRFDPSLTDAYYNRGFARQALGRTGEAAKDYAIVIKRRPAFTAAYMNRAISLSIMGRYSAALPDFGAAAELAPRDPGVYFNRGLTYSNLGRFREAASDFETVVRLSPGNGAAHYRLALAYSELGLVVQAKESLKRAAALGDREAISALRGMGAK